MVPRRFRRAYWRIFDAEGLEEARRELDVFRREWEREEPEVATALKTQGERPFQHLSLPYWWRHRVRTTNLGEDFLGHLRTFLRRFPGLKDERHAHYTLAVYLLSLQKKTTIGRTTPYQLQLKFNTGV